MQGNGESYPYSDDEILPFPKRPRTVSLGCSTSVVIRERQEPELQSSVEEEDSEDSESEDVQSDSVESEEEVDEDQLVDIEEGDDGFDANADREHTEQRSISGDREAHVSNSLIREDSNIVVTLTDHGLLDCPICVEPLTIPVFQCDQNGHIACASCCTKINNKCPSCSCNIGSNRCRAIEKIVESSTTSCQNMKYGCNTPLTYNKKSEHEKTCVCSPCSCPYLGCNFVSSTKLLYQHCDNSHLTSATSFMYRKINHPVDDTDFDYIFTITLKKSDNSHVLQEMISGTLFVLHNRAEALGNVVTISCIQPGFMEDFHYDLSVSSKQSSLIFRSMTKSISRLQANDHPSTSFLLIPCDFFDSPGQVKIAVCIKEIV